MSVENKYNNMQRKEWEHIRMTDTQHRLYFNELTFFTPSSELERKQAVAKVEDVLSSRAHFPCRIEHMGLHIIFMFLDTIICSSVSSEKESHFQKHVGLCIKQFQRYKLSTQPQHTTIFS